MAILTQPLRDEHRDLFPHVDQLRRAADTIAETSDDISQQGVDTALQFLHGHLIPHAAAEEAALYPVVARLMGAPEATATMSRDHVEVGRLTTELAQMAERTRGGEWDPELARDLRRVLYGLYALVGVHFAKEEEVYLPILDARLTPGEADELFHAMGEAAAAAHASVHAAHSE